jgi:hypothetical protein
MAYGNSLAELYRLVGVYAGRILKGPGRRQFMTLLGAAATWPLVARAQQAAMPVIGFLSSLSASVTSKRIASFGHGLSETSYVAGRDVTVEAHMAEGQYDHEMTGGFREREARI